MHERPPEVNPSTFPNQDIRVSEEFVQKHEELVVAAGVSLMAAVSQVPEAVDTDVRDALDSLIRTYRALQNGVVYESLPANPIAASVYRAFQELLASFRREEARRHAVVRTRDSDVLHVLVFFQRIELDRNNGRRRSRAFIGSLRGLHQAAGAAEAPASSLILP